LIFELLFIQFSPQLLLLYNVPSKINHKQPGYKKGAALFKKVNVKKKGGGSRNGCDYIG